MARINSFGHLNDSATITSTVGPRAYASRSKENMKTSPLPWSDWDQTLSRFGEWILVGTIASASLDPFPGLIALGLIIAFFMFDEKNSPPNDLKRYNEIKTKLRKKETITKEEEVFFSERDAHDFMNPPKRRLKTYWISVVAFVLCALYHFTALGRTVGETL